MILAQLRDGTPARIWPLLTTDANGLRAAFDGLSPASRRSRFLNTITELDETMLRRLIDDVDGERHIALVLVVFPPGGVERLIGVGRLVQDGIDPVSADLAITIIDEWQGRGAGSLLARALLARRPPTVRRLSTVVAADNAASLALMRGLGRTSSRPGGLGVLEVSVELPENEGVRS